MRTEVQGGIRPDHPALAGHFPGNPVVPGVVLLTELMQAFERSAEWTSNDFQINSVKFTAPLRPGEPFTIVLESSSVRRLSFVVTRGHTRIASGKCSTPPIMRSKMSCERSLARSTRTRQPNPHAVSDLDDVACGPSRDAMVSLSHLHVLRHVLARNPTGLATISGARPQTPGGLAGCLSSLSCVRLNDPRSGVSLVGTTSLFRHPHGRRIDRSGRHPAEARLHSLGLPSGKLRGPPCPWALR